MVSKPITSRRCRLGQLGREPTAQSEQPEVLYSQAHASEMLDVSLMTVRRLVQAGKLHVVPSADVCSSQARACTRL